MCTPEWTQKTYVLILFHDAPTGCAEYILSKGSRSDCRNACASASARSCSAISAPHEAQQAEH